MATSKIKDVICVGFEPTIPGMQGTSYKNIHVQFMTCYNYLGTSLQNAALPLVSFQI